MIFESNCCPDCTNVEIKSCKPFIVSERKRPDDRAVAPERMSLPDSTGGVSNRRDRLETIRPTTQPIKRVFLVVNLAGSAQSSIAASLTRLRSQTAAALRTQGFTVVEVPIELPPETAIAWINRRAALGDTALSIQTDAFSNPDARGIAAFYRAGSLERRQQAEQLIDQILMNVPNWIDRGIRPDTETAFGSLPFVRQMKIPAIALSVGFATSPQDRAIVRSRSLAIAQGIATGLVRWNQTPKPINLSINGKVFDLKGAIIEGSAYLPIEVLNQLKIDAQRSKTARLITSNNSTYIRAIDLRALGVLVGWSSSRRTVVLRTTPLLTSNKLSRIMGRGYLSKNTLKAFLQQNNPQAFRAFPEIADVYIEEATIEGVNPDIAFTQALIETNFFRFGGVFQPSRNNFAALKDVGSASGGAVFPNTRTGVRAHIQLLKTYASLEPLNQAIVTPRFRFIERGIAPQIEQLGRYYSDDPFYAEKILGLLRQLYEYQLTRTV
ncbi:N-acetylmuramoyl-L-alanine amidase [Leptolyngbya sp. FACHB-17]|uniref:N-acetylmuramoyl-L-alanine amidase n=1 Tax=unclassified Leptolyngbya TaxID=2650499 RepID=UPI0016803C07|nr:N-acetylmuramoyl-L-alanine amidase [Leptolyngbya sp. FACHB-17]MBD2083229.1 glucosaminidase domain-containing protein [Leptolyngbya sp. FACHB-17]